LLLSASGELYSWGSGAHYRLGHGTGDNVREPKLIAGLPRIQEVCAATKHCLAISDIGQVSNARTPNKHCLTIKYTGQMRNDSTVYKHCVIISEAGQVKSDPSPLITDIHFSNVMPSSQQSRNQCGLMVVQRGSFHQPCTKPEPTTASQLDVCYLISAAFSLVNLS